MRKWPEQHRILLITTVVLTVLAMLLLLFLIKPAWQNHSKARKEMKKQEAKLNGSKWPKDPERLLAVLREYKKILSKDNGDGIGLEEDTQRTLINASSMFDKQIENEYGTKSDFINKASQTEYKDQFDKLDTFLQGKGIALDTTVFGMNELSSENENYPMLLKLWTAKAVVDCVLASGLKITNYRQNGAKGRPSAQIKVLQAKHYFLQNNTAHPYLIEYPIYVEVSGNMKQLSAFADSLYSNGTFLPMTQLEIVSRLPGGKQPQYDDQGFLKGEIIVARIVCSALFMPSEEDPEAPTIESSISTPKPPGI